MKKFLDSKIGKYFFYMLLYVCVFTISYLGISFIEMTLNIFSWQNGSRVLVFVIANLITLGKMLVDYLDGK
tara:strand:+ start:543 stop:755 length:213 start_codon:yes stop_codon:yes gene_type:complete